MTTTAGYSFIFIDCELFRFILFKDSHPQFLICINCLHSENPSCTFENEYCLRLLPTSGKTIEHDLIVFTNTDCLYIVYMRLTEMSDVARRKPRQLLRIVKIDDD
jgi:hypothetical protein